GGGDVRVVGAVIGRADADVEDRLDAVVVLEQRLELLLVAEAGVVAADDDLQSHELLLRSGGRAGHPWGWDARGGRAGRRSGAGSGQVLSELLHEDREGDGAGVGGADRLLTEHAGAAQGRGDVRRRVGRLASHARGLEDRLSGVVPGEALLEGLPEGCGG